MSLSSTVSVNPHSFHSLLDLTQTWLLTKLLQQATFSCSICL